MKSGSRLELFVDGSFDPTSRKGGWGFVVTSGSDEIADGKGGMEAADSGAAEVMAVLQALLWLRQHAPTENAVIWSDSIYAVNGCQKWRHIWRTNGWKKRAANGAGRNRTVSNAAIWRDIDTLLAASQSIKIEWCKGHAEIFGNERAHQIAEIGRKTMV